MSEVKEAMVQEIYDIDLDLLEEKAQENDYWASCENFYLENAETKLKFLTGKQLNWLEKIQDDLESL